MKRYLFIVLLLSVFGFQYSACFAKANKQVVVLSCDLHCQGCCDKIMKNIAFEKGVKDIVCDLETKTVTVTFDANKTDVPTLLKHSRRFISRRKWSASRSQPSALKNQTRLMQRRARPLLIKYTRTYSTTKNRRPNGRLFCYPPCMADCLISGAQRGT